MKSTDYKELNYQFKTNINMKTKTSILVATKAFFILLVMCCLFSSCADGDKFDGLVLTDENTELKSSREIKRNNCKGKTIHN